MSDNKVTVVREGYKKKQMIKKDPVELLVTKKSTTDIKQSGQFKQSLRCMQRKEL